jgi:hypothetical protein
LSVGPLRSTVSSNHRYPEKILQTFMTILLWGDVVEST